MGELTKKILCEHHTSPILITPWIGCTTTWNIFERILTHEIPMWKGYFMSKDVAYYIPCRSKNKSSY